MKTREILVVVVILIVLALLFGCKNEVVATDPNEIEQLLTIVKDMQSIIAKIIECGNTTNRSLASLHNIDTLNMERMRKMEERLSALDSLKSVLLAENININGKRITGLSADERIELCQKIFEHSNEMQADPNDELSIIMGKYFIGDVFIAIDDFNFQTEPNEPGSEPNR